MNLMWLTVKYIFFKKRGYFPAKTSKSFLSWERNIPAALGPLPGDNIENTTTCCLLRQVRSCCHSVILTSLFENTGRVMNFSKLSRSCLLFQMLTERVGKISHVWLKAMSVWNNNNYQCKHVVQ